MRWVFALFSWLPQSQLAKSVHSITWLTSTLCVADQARLVLQTALAGKDNGDHILKIGFLIKTL